MNGTVTKIVRKTDGRTADRGGYFFVRGEDGHDRFAHARDLLNAEFDALKEHDPVTFEPLTVTSGKGNGLRAEMVRLDA